MAKPSRPAVISIALGLWLLAAALPAQAGPLRLAIGAGPETRSGAAPIMPGSTTNWIAPAWTLMTIWSLGGESVFTNQFDVGTESTLWCWGAGGADLTATMDFVNFSATMNRWAKQSSCETSEKLAIGLAGGYLIAPGAKESQNEGKIDPVPEPASLALLGLGLIVLAARLRWRRTPSPRRP